MGRHTAKNILIEKHETSSRDKAVSSVSWVVVTAIVKEGVQRCFVGLGVIFL